MSEIKNGEYEMETKTLPALTGSQKQIKWAMEIRPQKIKEIQEVAEQMKLVLDDEQWAKFSVFIDAIMAETKSGWWINNRNKHLDDILTEWALFDVEKMRLITCDISKSLRKLKWRNVPSFEMDGVRKTECDATAEQKDYYKQIKENAKEFTLPLRS